MHYSPSSPCLSLIILGNVCDPDINLMLMAVDVPALHGFQKVMVLLLLPMLMEICMSMKRQASFDKCGYICLLLLMSVLLGKLKY